METRLYHRDVYMPKLTFKDILVKLDYSNHAKDTARIKDINIIEYQYINLSNGKIIELETLNNKPAKIVMRYKYSPQYDIVIVILLNGLKVKTVWLNHINDTHSTLNTSKYFKP